MIASASPERMPGGCCGANMSRSRTAAFTARLATLAYPPRWLLTDRPTRWTPARCSASITLTTDS